MQDASELRLDIGLRHTAVAKTSISDIDPQLGLVHYRGHPVTTLAQTHSYVDVLHLLVQGSIPTAPQAVALTSALAAACLAATDRRPRLEQTTALRPMAFLQAYLAAPGAFRPSVPFDEQNEVEVIADAVMAVIHFERTRTGRGPYKFDSALSLPGNYLAGVSVRPCTQLDFRIMEQCFILIAEHGSNASTFAARVAASAGAGTHASLAAGASCFEGSLHGGAVELTFRFASSIATPEDVKSALKERRRQRLPIYGFGHRVYRAYDPRAAMFKSMCAALQKMDRGDLLPVLSVMETEMAPYAKKGVWPNAELYGGAVYHLLGIPIDLFCVTHALSRLAGWFAHICEQRTLGMIIRPALIYVGCPVKTIG